MHFEVLLVHFQKLISENPYSFAYISLLYIGNFVTNFEDASE